MVGIFSRRLFLDQDESFESIADTDIVFVSSGYVILERDELNDTGSGDLDGNVEDLDGFILFSSYLIL